MRTVRAETGSLISYAVITDATDTPCLERVCEVYQGYILRGFEAMLSIDRPVVEDHP